jgi:hypothetical protein
VTEDERIEIEAFNNFAQGYMPFFRKRLEEKKESARERIDKLILTNGSYKNLAYISGYRNAIREIEDDFEELRKQGLESS